MALDEDLVDRIRVALQHEDGVEEKKMFGGHAFLLGGNMAVAASGQGGLMVRCDPGQTDAHAAADGVERFEMGGRSMAGWLHIDPSAVVIDEALARWAQVGRDYARSLPAKR